MVTKSISPLPEATEAVVSKLKFSSRGFKKSLSSMLPVSKVFVAARPLVLLLITLFLTIKLGGPSEVVHGTDNSSSKLPDTILDDS